MIPKIAFKLVTDAISVGAVGIPVLVLFLKGEPFKRGYFCDDDSIRYPYKDSTVSSGVLYVYGIGVPVITMLVLEYLIFMQLRCNNNRRQFLVNVYCKLVVFAFGALVSQLLTDIAKYRLGRLRPHFYQVCESSVKCPDADNHRYIEPEEYECRNSNQELVRDARLSFMSGHSSFSAYTMVFTALYLQSRVKWGLLGFIRPVVQVILIYSAIYIGFTRISDYKHHWSDVLTGLLQGTLVAILIVRYVSDFFCERNAIDFDANVNQEPNDSLPIRNP